MQSFFPGPFQSKQPQDRVPLNPYFPPPRIYDDTAPAFDGARTFGPTSINTDILETWSEEQNRNTVFGKLRNNFSAGLPWSAMTEGVSAAVSRTQETASRTREQIQSVRSNALQRYVYSAISALVGVFFIALSITFLPLLVLKPQKFALLFTIGSMLLINSAGLFTGYPELFSHLIERQRIVFSIGYLASLIATLYTTLIMRSYFVTIAFSVIQMACLGTLLASYFTGSVGILGFWSWIFSRSTASIFGWTNSENRNRWTILPF